MNILGTEYEIKECFRHEDAFLEKLQCDGYCDCTSKVIAIRKQDDYDNADRPEAHIRRVKRHEIIHAYLFESGLGSDWTHEQGHDETTVDWMARQFPKIQKTFEEGGCTD